MKIILTLIILSAATCHAQSITIDPNSIVEANGFVTVNMRLTITAEQYEAMQYRNLTFEDMFRRSTFSRYFMRLVEQVKAVITKRISLAELRELER